MEVRHVPIFHLRDSQTLLFSLLKEPPTGPQHTRSGGREGTAAVGGSSSTLHGSGFANSNCGSKPELRLPPPSRITQQMV